ncbi:MAG: class I adenylate-forming enzyme family protein [Pseudomonadota bacterium]
MDPASIRGNAKEKPSLPPSLARISDYVAWHARRTPQTEAMVLGQTRVDYAAFHTATERLAKALIAAGVSRGDRVATLCPPSPDYFIAFLAAASIGAIWVGLNPRYRLNELSYVVSDSGPAILLARTKIDDRDYSPDLSALMAQSGSIRELILLDADNGSGLPCASSYSAFLAGGASVSDERLAEVRAGCGGTDPCMIVYTSGSTGRPKGALLHHRGIVEFSLRQNRIWPVFPLRTLNYFPINHVGCVVDISTPTLLAGGTIVFMERFGPEASLDLMEKERITLWGSVPSVFQLQLAERRIETVDLSAVQLIIWEGAAMPREMIDRLLAYGRPLASNYGMTESCGAITVVAPTRDVAVLEATVGWPFEDVEVRIVDAEGRPAPADETGEIEARSPFNMLGYWRRPEETARILSVDGWLRTGDLGRRNPDGGYSIVGRAKEMYKSGGYNVYPREVEGVIERHPSVDLAAVVSVDDPVWQEVGVAYLLLRAPASEVEVERHCRENLANYKIPKKFVILDAMPLLPIGKVDKVALKKRAATDYAASGTNS